MVTCSNAGICNISTGECECFPGYTGIACQRSKLCCFCMVVLTLMHVQDTCPNECSGHGTCVTISDMSLLKGPDYDHLLDQSGDGIGVAYANWDKESITQCSCDAAYFGPDCSLGMLFWSFTIDFNCLFSHVPSWRRSINRRTE